MHIDRTSACLESQFTNIFNAKLYLNNGQNRITRTNVGAGEKGHLAHCVCATATPDTVTHLHTSYLQVLPLSLQYPSTSNAYRYRSNSNLNTSTVLAATTFPGTSFHAQTTLSERPLPHYHLNCPLLSSYGMASGSSTIKFANTLHLEHLIKLPPF